MNNISILRKPLAHIIIIALFGIIAYSNTFHAPFQFDEAEFITGNPLIRDLSYFADTSTVRGTGFSAAIERRYVGYLTFALNYKLHGLDVEGYHIFNLAIHIMNAMLVYLLIRLTLQSPILAKSALRQYPEFIALFTALMYVAHPVQTESVTYVFQRLNSLMTFFYLSCLVLYAGWRLKVSSVQNPDIKVHAMLFISIISAYLAMKTKENAFTLPFIVMLYDFLFFHGQWKYRIIGLMPFLFMLPVIPLSLVDIGRPIGESVGAISPVETTARALPRDEYLFTQFGVVATYLRLILFPVNQNFDYDYPALKFISEPAVFLSLAIHIALISLALFLILRSKRGDAGFKLISFGIFWFYITLSVESSVIPIHMVIDEYRLYLPSIGIFYAFTCGALLLAGKNEHMKSAKWIVPFFVALSLLMLFLAYNRNSTWESKLSLWSDTAIKSPLKARPHNNLGNAYYDAGMMDKALEHYLMAIRLGPDVSNIRSFEDVKDIDPNIAKAYFNLGNAYLAKGMREEAIKSLTTALRIQPDYEKAQQLLELAYKIKREREAPGFQ